MRLLRDFRVDRAGSAAVEFAVVALLFATFFFMILDFGRALWDWNRAGKATHWGARYAIVNNMVPTGLQSLSGLDFGYGQGQSISPSDIVPNPVVCDNAGCNGYGPKDDAAFDAIVAEVQKIYGRVQPDNVVVEYEHFGCGFTGNPFGSDICPAVTVKLQNMAFNFVTGSLIGLSSLNMPDFATTLTGEDNAS